mgnify:CR=1 FL=1
MSEVAISRACSRAQRGPGLRKKQSGLANRPSPTARWNGPAGWRWIDGHWSSQVDLPISQWVGPHVGRGLPGLTIQSVDRWSVRPSGVGITLDGQRPSPIPVAWGMSVTFGPGDQPTLTMHSGERGRLIVMRGHEANGRSIVFQGEIEQGPRLGGLLKVTIERASPSRFRIISKIVQQSSHVVLFHYEARKKD